MSIGNRRAAHSPVRNQAARDRWRPAPAAACAHTERPAGWAELGSHSLHASELLLRELKILLTWPPQYFLVCRETSFKQCQPDPAEGKAFLSTLGLDIFCVSHGSGIRNGNVNTR